MKHLVIGQRQKAANFSAFHWSPHGSLISIGQHHKGSTFTEKDRKKLGHRIRPKRTLITELDQAVRAVNSCIMQTKCFESLQIFFKSHRTRARAVKNETACG